MATLTMPVSEPGTDIENFSVRLDFTNNTEALAIIINDNYPDIADGILNPRNFSYIITNQNSSPTEEQLAHIYGRRFIDQKNEYGQRKVIYHFDIDIDEFVMEDDMEGTIEDQADEETFLVQINTHDQSGNSVLLYSFEIEKHDDEENDDSGNFNNEQIVALIDKKIDEKLSLLKIDEKIEDMDKRILELEQTDSLKLHRHKDKALDFEDFRNAEEEKFADAVGDIVQESRKQRRAEKGK